jgi:hypothetical protein
MSNHLAAATVTATLRKTLQRALDTASPGISSAVVSTLRPSPTMTGSQPGVNVFLYQVTPSASLRNSDLPTRRGDGTALQRPQSALDLHYLISFSGDDAKLEPQLLLGIVTRALHSQPVITREMIQIMLADPNFSFLAESDLEHAPDLVRLTPVPLSLEELSKLWSVVFQLPYVLSQVYRASVVRIEGMEAPQPALPVASTAVVVDGSMGPVLEAFFSQATSAAPPVLEGPLVTGSFLVVAGRNLLAPVTRVRVGEIDLEPDPPSASATTLKVALPASVLAGVHEVSVIHRRGAVPSALDRSSNPLRFSLRPTITASFAAGNVTVDLAPSVGQAQRVKLLLNEVEAPAGQVPRAFAFDAPPRSSPLPVASLVIPAPGLAAGTFLVRVQVDGVDSLLSADPVAGRYSAPQVLVP